MERIQLADDLELTRSDERVSLHGELRRENCTAWRNGLDALRGCRVLELGDLDIADGVACTEAVNLIRHLLAVNTHLRIVAAPQVLAHNLYRTGLLQGDRIVLEAMREDEAYG